MGKMRMLSEVLLMFFLVGNPGESIVAQPVFSRNVITGADQTETYLPLLRGKRIALAANQTSVISNTHLADTLLSMGIQIQLVFSPEHGFRGTADAGQLIESSKDEKTGISLVSLYGKHKKPTADDLRGIDLVVFDIQDVGVRFYTYISTLHYIMEACAEYKIPVLILDRPNPNGFYVDGPILDSLARSFVGMHPVPLVHGMTIAEYALMINGEHWLDKGITCQLFVLPCKNYTHSTHYELPVKPSPNLPNIRSVLLYPSLGLFEGTIMSVGRGTPYPFQVYGHPMYDEGKFKFTPQPTDGAKYPLLDGKLCKGSDLREIPLEELMEKRQITLEYLITTYQALYKTTEYFNNYFYRLAGSHTLENQIKQKMTEEQIRATWQPGLEQFKKIRKKYLLYPDFE